MKLLPVENSLNVMPLFWSSKFYPASTTAIRTTSCYRDLKPENILLEQNKAFDQIKIIDFGTSLVYDPSKKLDEKLGTPYYIAPEVLNKKYGNKCDIWSIGVIVYILLCGSPPFSGQTDNDIMKAVRAGKVNFEGKGFSPVAIDFMQSLLTYDQEQRPSA